MERTPVLARGTRFIQNAFRQLAPNWKKSRVDRPRDVYIRIIPIYRFLNRSLFGLIVFIVDRRIRNVRIRRLCTLKGEIVKTRHGFRSIRPRLRSIRNPYLWTTETHVSSGKRITETTIVIVVSFSSRIIRYLYITYAVSVRFRRVPWLSDARRYSTDAEFPPLIQPAIRAARARNGSINVLRSRRMVKMTPITPGISTCPFKWRRERLPDYGVCWQLFWCSRT